MGKDRIEMRRQDCSIFESEPTNHRSQQLSPGIVEQGSDDELLTALDAPPVYELSAASEEQNITATALSKSST